MGHVEFFLEGVGVHVAPYGTVPGKDRYAAPQNIHIHSACPDIDKSDIPSRLNLVVYSVHILKSKGVHIDDYRIQTSFLHHRDVVVDYILLYRNENHVHLSSFFLWTQDLEVEVHILYVKGDILFCLKLY